MLAIYAKIAAMQILNNLTKIVFLSVVSCCIALLMLQSQNPVTATIPIASQAIVEIAANPMVEVPQTFSPAPQNIWNDMRSEFKLDEKTQSAQVQKEIRVLLADQAKLHSILVAAGPYIYYIHQQTQMRSLPAELALIPVIESEFNPNDHSNKGATGLWQLMSGTAHELGVAVKNGYDGRRNVIASTRAALAYFNDLGNEFKGNWYLAIAAYNCGQGLVEHAEKRAGSKSFWDLHLPQETKVYVPKLLAVAAIVKNPEKYGVQLPPINNQPYFTQVTVAKPVTLTQVAKNSGINLTTLKALNPDYKNGVVAKKANLLVPVSKVAEVKATIPVAAGYQV